MSEQTGESRLCDVSPDAALDATCPAAPSSAPPFERSARVYDRVYAARGKDYGAEAARLDVLLRQGGLGAGGRVLDVACGTGAHALGLRQLGWRVHGLDGSAAMVAVAGEKLGRPQVRLADMRRMPTWPEPFDAVICMFASIAYLPDLDGLHATCRGIAASLRSGGLCVIERGLAPEEVQPARLDRTCVDAAGAAPSVEREAWAERNGCTLRIRFRYRVAGPPGAEPETFDEVHPIHLFTAVDLDGALRRAGLEPSEADRGWIVARRR